NDSFETVALDEQNGKINRFRGVDVEKWLTDIPTFAKIKQQNVYSGVDLIWYGNAVQEIEYDFDVQPNGDFRQIEMTFDGADKIEIGKNGDLLIHTEAGIMRQRKPVTYQNHNGLRQLISSGFELRGENKVGFNVGDYDANAVLTIDPSLNYSTYLGGSGFDDSRLIVMDAGGNAYVAGHTFNAASQFPTTSGVFSTANNDNDVFITKLNSSGTALIYSTFLGGTGDDFGLGLAVDARGNAFVSGTSFEQSGVAFPTTNGAYQRLSNGASDGFVTKLNATGSSLIYSTMLGTTTNEYGYGVAIDSAGAAYFVGSTESSAFPTTLGAVQFTSGGSGDVFITKFSADGAGLTYSTYLGGTSSDEAFAVALDSSNAVYVTGQTFSSNFPVSLLAFDRTYNANSFHDAFVTKINPTGAVMLYSTFLGGANTDEARGIAVDSANNAYVVGRTLSNDFPATTGAFDASFNGNFDGFITKLDSNGMNLLYSTFIGGNGSDFAEGIALDSSNNAFVTGSTFLSNTVNFPVTTGSYDVSHNGSNDVFALKMNPTGTNLIYSTFLGGSGSDNGYGIATSTNGMVFAITGTTTSENFPTTTNAFDTTYNGNTDGFVTKFSLTTTAARLKIGGDVKSANNRGVRGASVTLMCSQNNVSQTFITNKRGNFQFENIAANDFCQVTVSHPKYEFTPDSLTFTTREDVDDLRFYRKF
ncbi:MAG: SBBP repeat-containing protein, partial [Pyrinomonadaceae bacterium]|nr:SBBP repeat-containing protein [Pyrinomonadaceae bacterium]